MNRSHSNDLKYKHKAWHDASISINIIVERVTPLKAKSLPDISEISITELYHSFCSVVQLSSIRGLATPWTYCLHLSLSSVILIDSSTDSPAHVLMLSIQAMRGLPRLCEPGIVPCSISFSRQLPCFLMV